MYETDTRLPEPHRLPAVEPGGRDRRHADRRVGQRGVPGQRHLVPGVPDAAAGPRRARHRQRHARTAAGPTNSTCSSTPSTGPSRRTAAPAASTTASSTPTPSSAMGQSCGGLEAIEASSDPRVDSTVLWNSGIFASGGIGGVDKTALTRLHGPDGLVHRRPVRHRLQQRRRRLPAGSRRGSRRCSATTATSATSACSPTPTVERHIVGVAADWLDATLFGNAQARAAVRRPELRAVPRHPVGDPVEELGLALHRPRPGRRRAAT